MYSPDTPRSSNLKLVEDSLRSRVDEAREALLLAKQNFLRCRLAEDYDSEVHREREITAARLQTRAMDKLLTAVIDFNAFILGETVPTNLPPEASN